MDSQNGLTYFNEVIEHGTRSIVRLANKVKMQKYSLSTARIENENLFSQLVELQKDNTNLQMELQAKTEQLELKTQEISGYQRDISDLESNRNISLEENAQLVQDVKILCRKVEQLDPLVDELQQWNGNLQSENQKLKAELAKKTEEIERSRVVEQQEADKMQTKDFAILEWTNKTVQSQVINEQLRLDLSKLQANLSQVEAKYKHSNEQLEGLKENYEREMNEWSGNYQQLLGEKQKYQIELDSFKDHDMVVKIFELHQSLQKLKTCSESSSKMASAQVNSERQVFMQNRLKDFCANYRRMTNYLGNHGIDLPEFDFASLDKCTRLHDDINSKPKDRLRRIKAIQKESESVWDAYKRTIYTILDAEETLINKYMAEIDEIGAELGANELIE